MTDKQKLGPWVRRFLLEHLVSERNLARNTQCSYRDTLALLLPFVARESRQQIDQLTIIQVTAELVRLFLRYLEESRGCSTATRNQRLAAIHALARFVGQHSPEHIEWAQQIRTIPFKKAGKSQVTYLDKPEIDALLAAPDRKTELGLRDHTLLLFLYNTGARADEAAQLRIDDLTLARAPQRDHSFVKILGKGNKLRNCPLWPQTVQAVTALIGQRAASEHVFLNRRGQPITRFGIHTLVERCVRKASKQMPALGRKRISPHVIRHTTGTHLLRAGVDINTIRAWLGHVSLNTTNLYAEIDLEMKAKALARCELGETKSVRHWREDKGLMAFLKTL